MQKVRNIRAVRNMYAAHREVEQKKTARNQAYGSVMADGFTDRLEGIEHGKDSQGLSYWLWTDGRDH